MAYKYERGYGDELVPDGEMVRVHFFEDDTYEDMSFTEYNDMKSIVDCPKHEVVKRFYPQFD